MKACLITCPERAVEAGATLRALKRTDFPGAPFIYMDFGHGPPSATRHALHRRRTMAELLDEFPAERLFLLLEDDIEFAPGWWERLGRWRPLDRGLLLASLYRPSNCGLFGSIAARGRSAMLDAPALGFWGGQAVVLSRDFIELALRRWDDPQPSGGLPNWDKRIAAAAAAEKLPVTYHVPCLIQHRCAPSLVGSVPHQSSTYAQKETTPS